MKIKLDHQTTAYTRKKSKWITDLNESHETIKILKESIGSKISDICHSDIFDDMSPKAKKIFKK